jgi:peptidoglycan/LPS O-acetylase OafA/YrhL
VRERLGYVPALDGLRAAAIALVVCHHYFGWPFGGGVGVDLFFVLSGFLITSLLLEERTATGAIRLRRFYWRRARRLVPALVVVLAGYLLLAAVKGRDELGTVAKAGFYTANLVQAYSSGQRPPLDPTGIGHLWSLAQEEQFYLVWPWVLLLLARSRRIVFWLGLLLTGLLLYRYALLWRGVSLRRIYYSPDLHSEGLVAGALLAAFRARRPRFAVGEAIAQASVPVALICALGLGTGDVIWAWGLPVFELAAVGMVAAALSATAFASFFAARPLVWLGQRSYSLYLWHMPILWTVGHRDRLLGLALSFLAASLSYRYVEQPFRRRSAVAARTPLPDPLPRIEATAVAVADALD